MKTGACYWRFKGERVWLYGYATQAGCGLYRMGYYNGDATHGPIVDPNEIEVRYES